MGTILSPLLALIGFMADHIKELQAISFAMSVLIGILTVPWWLRKWWKEFFSDERPGPSGD